MCMKKQLLPSFTSRTVFLFFFLLSVSHSCNPFHRNTVNPETDFVSDHLQNVQVNKIRIIIPDSILFSPGSSFPIGVIASSSKGKELKTRGLCNGFVNWNSYSVEVEGGVFEKGIVTIDSDPKKTDRHFKISIAPFVSPQLKQEVELVISYKTNFIANCKGQKGISGKNGLSGEEVHQLDTTRRKKNNYSGWRGQAGSNGETGGDGCVADAFVKAMTLSGKKLMNVLVINHCDNSHLVFWIDPDGGSLTINVSGGEGGNGGDGGDGEAGIDGAGADPLVGNTSPRRLDFNPKYVPFPGPYAPNIDLAMDSTKNPSGNGGRGGIGGNGGRGGNGGNGGVAVIHLDSSAVEWKNKIVVNNSAGKPGKSGTGGYAGKGGRAAYLMSSKTDGDNGYIGAEGIKGESGKPGSATIWRTESVKLVW